MCRMEKNPHTLVHVSNGKMTAHGNIWKIQSRVLLSCDTMQISKLTAANFPEKHKKVVKIADLNSLYSNQSAQTFSNSEWISINIWMSWKTLIIRWLAMVWDSRTASDVKAVKYAKRPNIWHDKIMKERALGCCLLELNTSLIIRQKRLQRIWIYIHWLTLSKCRKYEYMVNISIFERTLYSVFKKIVFSVKY